MKHRLAAATLSRAAALALAACALSTPVLFAQTPTGPIPSAPPRETEKKPAATTPAADPREGDEKAVGTVGVIAPIPDAKPIVTPDPKAPAPAARDPRVATVAADPRIAEMANAYQIGPEDLLDISVWKNLELSRTVPVRPDGNVSLPLVNDIHAAGLTPSELRDQITTRLAEYIPAPEVSVMVREVHSRKVAVVGAVKMPGRYDIKSPMTVLEAIALAQGLTDFASRDRIVILRQVNGKTTRIPFNYRKIADGSEQENFFVRAGDIVVVP